MNCKKFHREKKLHFLVYSAKGWQSVQCTICHPAQIEKSITYKGIRKVISAESIYPIPIVWMFKILKMILFQELLFKTMQCLFWVKIWYLKIWVDLKNNKCASKKNPKEAFICQAHVFNFNTLAYLNKYVEPNNCSYMLIFFNIILFSGFAKKLMSNNEEINISVSIKLQWFMSIAKHYAKQNSV